MHRHHRRAVVVHEVPPDLVGPVGEPRAQQQHGGVHRPGREHHESPPTAAAPRRPCRTRPRRSARPLRRPAGSRARRSPASRSDARAPSRSRRVSPSLLAPVVSGKASQGVAARFSQPSRSIPSGSDDGVTPAALQPRPHRGDARLVRHRRKRIASGVPRLGRVLPARRHGRRRAPRPPDTRARARRRRSASRASFRRDAGSGGSPRRGSGSAPRRRASSCRRHSSSCPG